jgi:SAM-dependent methyltransferase
VSTPWSKCGAQFLREGDWSEGQGIDAPDRVLLRERLAELATDPDLDWPLSLLDVGCGTGITLDGIVRDAIRCEYAGLDLTPEFIEAAQQRYPKWRFRVGDLYGLNDAKGFDIVTARAVLEHVDDPAVALARLYGKCRKLLFVAFFIAPGEFEREVTDDGFIQQRCDVEALGNAVYGCAPSRFESATYEHAGQEWAIWELWR